jgi:hypothetical protein
MRIPEDSVKLAWVDFANACAPVISGNLIHTDLAERSGRVPKGYRVGKRGIVGDVRIPRALRGRALR